MSGDVELYYVLTNSRTSSLKKITGHLSFGEAQGRPSNIIQKGNFCPSLKILKYRLKSAIK